MSSAYAARMAFAPQPSSLGGFGAIAGHTEEELHADRVAILRDERAALELEKITVAREEEERVAEVDVREEHRVEKPVLAEMTTAATAMSAPSNEIGLSLLQLQTWQTACTATARIRTAIRRIIRPIHTRVLVWV